MKKMKLILNESLISNKDSDIIEDTSVQAQPDYQIIDVTVIPDEDYYPTVQAILIDLDEDGALLESDGNKLDINILSETVNQKTNYSNSLFEFESANHTITLSLVLQETEKRGIYKVEAYTTRGVKVFESNTYKPKYVIESYLNSLANEYLIDKPLNESVRIYDDEKDYSTDLYQVFNIVADFINDEYKDNLKKYFNYRGKPDNYAIAKGISEIAQKYGYRIDFNNVKHENNIGNNCGFEIFTKDNECIGYLISNDLIYGSVFVNVEDLRDVPISGGWTLRDNGTCLYKESDDLKNKVKEDYEEEPIETPVEDYEEEPIETPVEEVEEDEENYSLSEFADAEKLKDEVLNLDIDYSEWNESTPEEREELVRPAITEFVNKHREEFDEDPKVLEILEYELTDKNFHTEVKVMEEIYRGGKNYE